MMHVDGKHRVLDVFVFNNSEEFMFSQTKIPDYPAYLLIGHRYRDGMVDEFYELHGYHFMKDEQPCKLADRIKDYGYLENVPNNLKNWEIVYISSENQIYQKFEDKLVKGFIMVAQCQDNSFRICTFDDFIEIDKINVYDTCEQMVNGCFDEYDFETMQGILKPYRYYGCRVVYCKENRNLYAIVDDENLNLIHSDVEYGNIHNDCELVVSKSRNLFSHGRKISDFNFTYNELIYKIKFA